MGCNRSSSSLSVFLIWGKCWRIALIPARSRGWAELLTTRLVNRSRSPMCCSSARNSARSRELSKKTDTLFCRCSIFVMSSNGLLTHWRMQRCPMGVIVRSKTESNEPWISPRRMVSVSSRLRRVAASSTMNSLVLYVASPFNKAIADGWVCSRYWMIIPLVWIARGRFSSPKPSNVETSIFLKRISRHRPVSNRQSGIVVRLPVRLPFNFKDSGRRISTGFSRANSDLRSVSGSADSICVTANSPVVISA